jgi:hypothetical protein
MGLFGGKKKETVEDNKEGGGGEAGGDSLSEVLEGMTAMKQFMGKMEPLVAEIEARKQQQEAEANRSAEDVYLARLEQGRTESREGVGGGDGRVDASRQRRASTDAFIDDLVERGAEAILDHPQIVAALEQRQMTSDDYMRARQQLESELPEVYQQGSDMAKAREKVRQSFVDLGVPPSSLNSRMFEQLSSYAAAGMEYAKGVKSGKQFVERDSKDADNAFVEGGDGGGGPQSALNMGNFELTKEQLNDKELEVIDSLGIDGDTYVKAHKMLTDNNMMQRKARG